MADIDVVRKRSSVWVWIVAAIVLVAILWFVLGRGTRTAASGMKSIPSERQGSHVALAAPAATDSAFRS